MQYRDETGFWSSPAGAVVFCVLVGLACASMGALLAWVSQIVGDGAGLGT